MSFCECLSLLYHQHINCTKQNAQTMSDVAGIYFFSWQLFHGSGFERQSPTLWFPGWEIYNIVTQSSDSTLCLFSFHTLISGVFFTCFLLFFRLKITVYFKMPSLKTHPLSYLVHLNLIKGSLTIWRSGSDIHLYILITQCIMAFVSKDTIGCRSLWQNWIILSRWKVKSLGTKVDTVNGHKHLILIRPIAADVLKWWACWLTGKSTLASLQYSHKNRKRSEFLQSW